MSQYEDAVLKSFAAETLAIQTPKVAGLPEGYKYGATRYADLILRYAFPTRFAELTSVLESFRITAEELVAGGGNRADHTARFDQGLEARGWGKRTITLGKLVDGVVIHQTRGHEIDMFCLGDEKSYPGIAVEMEWNNKDPFFDRDLLNFQALHHEGALAVGVVVTRGPNLQRIIGPTIRGTATSAKFGQSTTHWDKLVPRVSLGGGGECPLFLIGIEPGRIIGFEKIQSLFDAHRQVSRDEDFG